MADKNNNIDPNDSGIALESDKAGADASNMRKPMQLRAKQKASLRGNKQPKGVYREGSSETDESQSEGGTSDMADIRDDGSSLSTDKRGQSQGPSNKPMSFGEMALQKLQRGRGRPRSRTTSVDRAPKAQRHLFTATRNKGQTRNRSK